MSRRERRPSFESYAGFGSWREEARCRFVTEYHHPPGEQYERKPEKEKRQAKARDMCAKCTVKEQCLIEGVINFKKHDIGIWGGLDEKERGALFEEFIKGEAVEGEEVAS